MNCPETNKKIVDPPHSGGGGSQGKINCCLPHPPPTPTQVGEGVGVKTGGTDGREGGRDVMAIMKLTQCIWHGMGA